MTVDSKNIACIGAGYIGGPTMAVIAKMNKSRRVTVVDVDASRISAWNSPDYTLPVYEPGLVDVIKETRGRNLFFSTNTAEAIRNCGIIFIGVNTPTKSYGNGAGSASDTRYFEAAVRDIAEFANGDKIIVEKSTIPVKTADNIRRILSSNSKYKFEVVSNPEFLAEGSAIRNLLNPDRILIGGYTTTDGIYAVDTVAGIYRGDNGEWVDPDRILRSDIWSSELSKLASNAFLAQRVSSINALTALCEKVGADISAVSKAVGSDSRIGNKFLRAGPGFGGSCFTKDVLNLIYLCDSNGLTEVADYWRGVISVNKYQRDRIVSRLLEANGGSLSGKKIAVFGFSFKANTGDTRDTPAGYVVRKLVEERANVSITDPKALNNAEADLADISGISFVVDPYDAAHGADAVLVMTDWEAYRKLDWGKVYGIMRRPAVVFDTRNMLNLRELTRIGFSTMSIGGSSGPADDPEPASAESTEAVIPFTGDDESHTVITDYIDFDAGGSTGITHKASSDTTSPLSGLFDKAFLVCFTGCKDRSYSAIEEIKRVGVTPECIWQFPTPMDKYFVDSVPHVPDFDKRPGWANSWFGHYRAMKTAYELGCSSALIMEDDLRFLKDTSRLHDIASDVPDDFDLALLDHFYCRWDNNGRQEYRELVRNKRTKYWSPYSYRFFSAACYLVSRRMMERLIWLHESIIDPATEYRMMRVTDYWHHRGVLGPSMNLYFSTPNCAIQRNQDGANRLSRTAGINEYYRNMGISFDNYAD